MMKNKTVYQASLTPDPSQDGVSHINVHYRDSKTQLGRMVSTYYVSHFTHPYFGPFRSIEGFLSYVKTGCRDDAFRDLPGNKAKMYHQRLLASGMAVDQEIANLEQLLTVANFVKIQSNRQLKEIIQDSTLPFDEYFLYGPGKIPIRPRNTEPFINSLNRARQYVIDGEEPTPLTDEQYAALIKR